jgi:hypothetical protein
MFRRPARTWILSDAAVFSGRHGAATRQAEQAGCSRQTVYQHALMFGYPLSGDLHVSPDSFHVVLNLLKFQTASSGSQ